MGNPKKKHTRIPYIVAKMINQQSQQDLSIALNFLNLFNFVSCLVIVIVFIFRHSDESTGKHYFISIFFFLTRTSLFLKIEGVLFRDASVSSCARGNVALRQERPVSSGKSGYGFTGDQSRTRSRRPWSMKRERKKSVCSIREVRFVVARSLLPQVCNTRT